MFLRTLPLRLKLIAAVLIPLAVVAGFLGVQVAGGLEARESSQQQLDEVLRFEAVVAYATSIGAEAQTITDGASTSADLEAARAAADAAWAAVAAPETDIDANRIEDLQAVQLAVSDIRSTVGTDPAVYRSTIQRGSTNAMADNPVSRLNGLRNQALSDFGFDRSSITDPEAAQFLNDVQLLERIESNLAIEGGLLISARNVLGVQFDTPTLVAMHNAISRTDESIAVFSEVGSAEATALFAEIEAGTDWQQLERVRDSLRGTEITGLAVTTSVADIQSVFLSADQALTEIEIQETQSLDTLARESRNEASGQLIRAGAIGGGLLLLVAIIVFVLYQAIRQPLRELTQEARRVTEVELPEVVRAVRAGEAGAGEEIEQIDAYTDDEIGELVAAFNGMHRTAVDLAAEQAGSRRVVADMFVNLGRRNQKLLNRMLKGLTVLEREEQDPDKLEALYKVDHLATRMRRNAESLLILAGASQARSWSKSVPVYDVMQAALAEVENFERVEIEVTDEDMVKGDYVADLAHILAELTENALAFSPPNSQVDVLARQTRRGYAIVISDAGIGMPADQLEAANARIIAAGSQDETPSEFLGHYVVGRLAARHGLSVDLLEGVAGLSVRVLLPDHIFDRAEEEVQDDLSGLSGLSGLATAAPEEAFATEPEESFATVPEESFATVPEESMPIDSIPAPEAAAEMDPFEEAFASTPEDSLAIDSFDDDFASAPADSLPIEALDDDFASAPADSLDWDETPATEAAAVVEEPAIEEPVVDEPVTEAPVAEAPVAEVPAAVEPAAEAPVVDEPFIDEVTASDPAQPLVPPIELPQRRPKNPVVEQERAESPAPTFNAPPSGAPASMPEPAPAPTPAPVAEVAPVAEIAPIAEEAPEPAFAGAFGVRRRKPGANLPVTTITPKTVIETDLDNPDDVRSSLSGFQSGTTRADKENN